jgi:hypothetical protein
MFPFIKPYNELKCTIEIGKNQNQYIIQLEEDKKTDIVIRLKLCYNPGRPHFDFFIDDKFIKKIKSTTGSTNYPGIEGPRNQYEVINTILLSGKHTLKFIMDNNYGNTTCSGCNILKIEPLNKTYNLAHKDENIFEIEIP